MRRRPPDLTARPTRQHHANQNNSEVVGTWVWTSADNLHVLDRDATEILTGNPDLADRELPFETVIQRVHPDDLPMLLATMERVAHESGPVVMEYRVQTPGGTRWLLDHGRTYPAIAGMPAHGHGVLIDVTHQKLWGADVSPGQPETPLERAAKHAIATREAIAADGSASLRLMIDMVLLEIGRVISRRVAKDRTRGMN